VPKVRRSRALADPPAAVWATVGDPTQLARWWPKVVRIEGADDDGFTQVLMTDRGRSVRADFLVLERHEGEVLRWGQEVEGTPFDRILRSAETTVRVTPEGEGARVGVEVRQRLRGVAALGGFIVRHATRRIVDEALDGLEEVHGTGGR
jgi:uncharacterized protein YndB with AHSA1/START domain